MTGAEIVAAILATAMLGIAWVIGQAFCDSMFARAQRDHAQARYYDAHTKHIEENPKEVTR